MDPEIYEENQNKDSELREPEGDETSEKQIKRKRSEFEKEQQKVYRILFFLFVMLCSRGKDHHNSTRS